MNNRVVSTMAVSIVGVALCGAVALQAQARQRSMYVSVLDQAGAPVLDVAPADLTIREDGVQREILRVVPADEPLQLALLIDDSQASSPFIAEYRTALPKFFATVLEASPSKGQHQIALIGLAARPTIITDYTSDLAQLQKGVDRVFSQTDTATYLLDGIIEVSRGLMRRASTRPAIVAVLTEGPEYSHRHYNDALVPLEASGAAFHAITLGSPTNTDSDRSIFLRRGSERTGGQLETLLAASALPGRLEQLAAELTHQFRVVYARPQSLVPPERVTVTAARTGLTVRGTVVPEGVAQDRP